MTVEIILAVAVLLLVVAYVGFQAWDRVRARPYRRRKVPTDARPRRRRRIVRAMPSGDAYELHPTPAPHLHVVSPRAHADDFAERIKGVSHGVVDRFLDMPTDDRIAMVTEMFRSHMLPHMDPQMLIKFREQGASPEAMSNLRVVLAEMRQRLDEQLAIDREAM